MSLLNQDLKGDQEYEALGSYPMNIKECFYRSNMTYEIDFNKSSVTPIGASSESNHTFNLTGLIMRDTNITRTNWYISTQGRIEDSGTIPLHDVAKKGDTYEVNFNWQAPKRIYGAHEMFIKIYYYLESDEKEELGCAFMTFNTFN
mmetsp:Transcript_10166/g.8971  ORF Transcript_10166/g.8971 Transcript_10166/m.8971 type:complete len:146 (+) Transcript_10166:99-536(+)|eukprot:CAMPEP_0205824972 /NCGR_PEP_ID=MMETSP0206-20130828/23402_1 /ASSEMBLY_ACC=CAM_ASM_000279 /TAXON_ID=36767 /ORGANISM="Euplotes focardii, Strain TN1" /LENGTH=145 /DNA_ID=CAMNT_0053123581 /DNA_START=71 /DNA_END=508 /DNA_ORIENTATION=-